MLIENKSGNYSFIPGGSPYSAGAIASSGYELIHAVFEEPVPLPHAFEAIGTVLAKQKRPLQALCALELRSPAPVSFAGFAEFNEQYRGLLTKYGLLPEGANPIARTNVAPAVLTPSEPVVYAFTYSALSEDSNSGPTFVVSGAGELENSALDIQAIRRGGEQSADAMSDKADLVMDIMTERLEALGTNWQAATLINVYTVHNIHSFLEKGVLGRAGSAAKHGVCWHYSQPPVTGIEFEMDVHGFRIEQRVRSRAIT